MDAPSEALAERARHDRELTPAADNVDAGDVFGRAADLGKGAVQPGHDWDHGLDRPLHQRRAGVVKVADGDEGFGERRETPQNALEIDGHLARGRMEALLRVAA